MHLCFQTCVRIVLLASSSFLLQVFAVPSAFFWSWSFWCFFFGDAFVLGIAFALGNAFALAFALGMAFAALLLGALRASFFPGLLSFPGPGFMRLRRVFSGGLSPSVSGWGSVRLSSISGVTGWDLDGAELSSILGGIRLVSGVAGLANPGVSSWFVSLTSGWFTSGWGSSEIPGSSKIPGLSQSSGKSPSFGPLHASATTCTWHQSPVLTAHKQDLSQQGPRSSKSSSCSLINPKNWYATSGWTVMGPVSSSSGPSICDASCKASSSSAVNTGPREMDAKVSRQSSMAMQRSRACSWRPE